MTSLPNIHEHYEVERNGYLISTNPTKLDFSVIHSYLSEQSYWSAGIPKELVQKAAQGAICFGVYDGEKQIGYTRLITDAATFGYLADVFILEEYQGQGLGTWLVDSILAHPACQEFRRWFLATRDAHGLYAKFGFAALQKPEVYMEKVMFHKYN
ncbi:MAG: GNAT family N-acetyltransferase [Saprospiraceae bacterium]|nr:GNAT family N-acetyltransferase [Saprospiraceae bacterium]